MKFVFSMILALLMVSFVDAGPFRRLHERFCPLCRPHQNPPGPDAHPPVNPDQPVEPDEPKPPQPNPQPQAPITVEIVNQVGVLLDQKLAPLEKRVGALEKGYKELQQRTRTVPVPKP